MVTGAGGGIGKAIADKLAAEGAMLCLTDINEESFSRSNCNLSRDMSTYAVCDVTIQNLLQVLIKKPC